MIIDYNKKLHPKIYDGEKILRLIESHSSNMKDFESDQTEKIRVSKLSIESFDTIDQTIEDIWSEILRHVYISGIETPSVSSKIIAGNMLETPVGGSYTSSLNGFTLPYEVDTESGCRILEITIDDFTMKIPRSDDPNTFESAQINENTNYVNIGDISELNSSSIVSTVKFQLDTSLTGYNNYAELPESGTIIIENPDGTNDTIDICLPNPSFIINMSMSNPVMVLSMIIDCSDIIDVISTSSINYQFGNNKLVVRSASGFTDLSVIASGKFKRFIEE